MSPSYEDEIELMSHLRRLQAGKWMLLAAVLVGGGLGILVESLLPHMYRGTATLRVADPQMRDADPRPGVAEMILLFDTNRVIKQVVDEFDLAGPTYDLPPNDFREQLRVRTFPGTSFIAVSVELPDADLARQVTNRVAELAVEFHEELIARQIERNLSFLAPQLDSARRRMTARPADEDEGADDASRRPSSAQGAEGLAGPMGDLVELFRGYVEPTPEEVRRDAAAELYAELFAVAEMVEFNVVSRNVRMELIDPETEAEPTSHSIVAATLLGATLGFLLVAAGLLVRGLVSSAPPADRRAT